MTEVGDYVRLNSSPYRDKIGKVVEKFLGNGSYLFNCYIIDLGDGKRFEFYRKEFKQISKDEVMIEAL